MQQPDALFQGSRDRGSPMRIRRACETRPSRNLSAIASRRYTLVPATQLCPLAPKFPAITRPAATDRSICLADSPPLQRAEIEEQSITGALLQAATAEQVTELPLLALPLERSPDLDVKGFDLRKKLSLQVLYPL
jgi:hypothetical protein